MNKTIDACGLTCPAPVLLVKDAVEQRIGRLVILVDNEASRENVTRFLGTRGYTVTHLRDGDVSRLEAHVGELDDNKITGKPETDVEPRKESEQRIVILITTDRLGTGDDTLGKKLIVNYLKTLHEIMEDLWQLIFINSGVKLTVGSSPVLEELQQYEKDGTIILACGTCLEHFGLTAEKEVGGTTNMLDIVTATQLADKVITIS